MLKFGLNLPKLIKNVQHFVIDLMWGKKQTPDLYAWKFGLAYAYKLRRLPLFRLARDPIIAIPIHTRVRNVIAPTVDVAHELVDGLRLVTGRGDAGGGGL